MEESHEVIIIGYDTHDELVCLSGYGKRRLFANLT